MNCKLEITTLAGTDSHWGLLVAAHIGWPFTLTAAPGIRVGATPLRLGDDSFPPSHSNLGKVHNIPQQCCYSSCTVLTEAERGSAPCHAISQSTLQLSLGKAAPAELWETRWWTIGSVLTSSSLGWPKHFGSSCQFRHVEPLALSFKEIQGTLTNQGCYHDNLQALEHRLPLKNNCPLSFYFNFLPQWENSDTVQGRKLVFWVPSCWMSHLRLPPSGNDSSESIKKSFLKNSHVPLYNQLVSYSLKRLLLNILFLLRQTESETAFVFLNLLTLQKGRSSSQPYIVVPYCLCCTEIVRIRTVRATELLQLVSHFTERERQLSCLVFPPLEQICLYHCFKCFQYSVALRRVGIHPSQCREC